MRCDAVFEGGGVKGVAFIGAIQETERRGYHFERLAGTSAGAITASLLAAGYNGQEIENFLDELSFKSFVQPNWIGRIPLIGKGLNVMLSNGIYSSDPIEKWVQKKLVEKGVHTFGDLPENKLQIIASDITNGRMIQIPKDLSYYGKKGETFSVARAVRMSCTIPFFFRPAVVRREGRRSCVVDGGLLSNFPVWIFDARDVPRYPTFGFRLQGSDAEQPADITGPLSMSLAILSTMLEAHDRRYIKPRDAKRTIFIPVEGVKATDFNLSSEEKEQLIELGRKEAGSFFDEWNFTQYVNQYRRPLSIKVNSKNSHSPVAGTDSGSI